MSRNDSRFTRRWARLLQPAAVLGMVLTLSCTMPTGPLPDGAERIEPPLIFRVWWQQVESCAGRSESFRAVTWYRVPVQHELGFPHRGRLVTGLWAARGNRILLSDHVLESPPIVRHEMLHAILRSGDHPTHYFVVRCGDWVAQRG